MSRFRNNLTKSSSGHTTKAEQKQQATMQDNAQEYTVKNATRVPGRARPENNNTTFASNTDNTPPADTTIGDDGSDGDSDDDDGNDDGTEMKGARRTGTLKIGYVVKHHVFRKHKFISGNVDLTYNTNTESICGIYLDTLGVLDGENESHKRDLWERARNFVAITLNGQRNNTTKAMRDITLNSKNHHCHC